MTRLPIAPDMGARLNDVRDDCIAELPRADNETAPAPRSVIRKGMKPPKLPAYEIVERLDPISDIERVEAAP
jgi:hypothetical protein